jgi:hypothetical protein
VVSAFRVATATMIMLARSRILPLTESGLTGPLLVPSVSSKGFPVTDGLSEAGAVLPIVINDLGETLLISAYDVHHGFLPDHELLSRDERAETMYDVPSLLVLDSGGYELSDEFDSGERNQVPHVVRSFGRPEFDLVVRRLSHERDLLVVTYDEPDFHRRSYREQREDAQAFADQNPKLKIDFILRPPAGDAYIDSSKLTQEAEALARFNVIGVTEKELGDTVLDRVLCLARLRRLLDSSGGATVPMHVFGALDPVLTPAYFMAGAEMFDGLSWLRYAYRDEMAVHPDELAVLTGSLETHRVLRDAERYLSNLRQLSRLGERLREWAREPERYELLGRHHQRFREIYEMMQDRLREG